MNDRREKWWVVIFLMIFGLGLTGTILAVVSIDPFFHYHAPLTETYFYRLSNERSQNDGITRYFDYDGLITGTSVTQNFKTTKADELFGRTFIKIPYSGATYREISEGVIRALERNVKLKTVIRGVDLEFIIAPKDYMRDDMGVRPEYLYDENLLNDISYVLNRDVMFSWVCRMMIEKDRIQPGITGFDDYSSWSYSRSWYGASKVCPDGIERMVPGEPVFLSEEQENRVRASVCQNMTDPADRYPDTEFIYFIPPNSMVWWYEKVEDGSVYALVEAEKIMMEEMLQHPNIRLYTWNDRTEITGNLDHYTDTIHYGEWINDMILQFIKEKNGLVTPENYGEILERELDSYLTFDYQSMMK